jgi:hypothetical protein
METSYVYYIIDFIRFHGKCHPKAMGLEEIRAYLSHLAIEGNVAESTQAVLPSPEFGRPNGTAQGRALSIQRCQLVSMLWTRLTYKRGCPLQRWVR